MNAVSDTAAQAAIGAAARELKLPTVRAEAARLAEIAVRERHTHLAYLAEVLSAELDDRTGRRRTRRIAEAKFPRLKRLADFNADAVPGITPAQSPAGQRCLHRRRRAGRAARRLRHRQDPPADRARPGRLRARPPGPLRHHRRPRQRARRSRRRPALSRVVGRYGRLDLLLLDELGYVQIDPRGAELLFQIITEREERASIAIGTNLPFSEWGTVFPDPRLVAAIVDRVTFNAHILETGTQSYRLAPARPPAAAGGPARTPRARDDMPARRCAECGQRLPRPFPGPGRLQQYCTPACRQKAYRRRGGRASGTTGAHRRRQQRANPPSDHQPNPGAKIHDDRWGQIT